MCEVDVVRDLVAAAPGAIARLIRLGARFDRDASGDLDLHLEGGHSARRIVHADGDASGAEVERALWASLCTARAASRTRLLEHTRLVDVLTDAAGRACGVRLLDGTASSPICSPTPSCSPPGHRPVVAGDEQPGGRDR
nr:FAD-binding protein [Tessaracoccus coleopterorum]